jgi:hypothetical protein
VWRYENAADRERLIMLEPPVDWELAITKRGERDPDAVAVCPREVRVDASLVAAHDVAIQGDVASATGADPYLTYRIPDRGHVCGVRITYELATPRNENARLQLFWAREGVTAFVASERNSLLHVPATAAPQTTTFHVDDEVDVIRIDPHTVGTRFKLLGVVLLLEPEGT